VPSPGPLLNGDENILDIIAFDADDTLWHNETIYANAQAQLAALLGPYSDEEHTHRALHETQMRNLRLYGYGIKAFGLSMIETAIGVSNGRIASQQIEPILALVKEMLEAPVELLDGVAEVIPVLAGSCRLMLVTKGDLRDQEVKLARSGLAPYFACVEIVREKSTEIYQALLARHGIVPERFLMVGNSLRSDVLPVIALGGHAVHIPYHITWEHEAVPVPEDAAEQYVELPHIGLLPAYVKGLCGPEQG
jgi:putative hydrolase of the HAD superfamily